MEPKLRATIKNILMRHSQGANSDDVIIAIHQAYEDAGYFQLRQRIEDLDPNAPEDIKLKTGHVIMVDDPGFTEWMPF